MPTAHDSIDVSSISGNAPDHVKAVIGNPGKFFASKMPTPGPIFGQYIQNRLKVTEVSINKKAEEPKKLEGRVVVETTVEDDMLNGGGNIHGGCSAFLIDICSTLAVVALNLANNRPPGTNVSQALNVVYHSPARLGDKIRIVNQTIALGARAQSIRTEIWSITHRRLVSSGTHIKMQPSTTPKANL